MEIYILSKGRAHKQTTFNNLPPSLQQRTLVAVYPEELGAYGDYPTFAVNCKERGVGHKRQYLVNQCKSNHILMLDDDLVFANRRLDEPEKFCYATPESLEALFADIDESLGEYAHVGVSGREGANRDIRVVKKVGRMTRVLGYQVDVLKANNVRFDEMQLMEDFNVTLRLLRLGLPNLILNYMVQNQNGSDTSGGVSTYRTKEKQAGAAEELARRHPGFVKVVEKTTKSAWGGGTRKDVIVQWGKAYDSAQ